MNLRPYKELKKANEFIARQRVIIAELRADNKRYVEHGLAVQAEVRRYKAVFEELQTVLHKAPHPSFEEGGNKVRQAIYKSPRKPKPSKANTLKRRAYRT